MFASKAPAVRAVAPGFLRRRVARRNIGVLALFVLALVLGYASLVPLGDRPGAVKVPLALVGVAVGFKAVDTAGRAIRGDRFDTGLWLSVAWLVVLVSAATFADVLPLGSHNDPGQALTDPGNLRPDLLSAHPLGTNNFGLDLLARSIYAARVSLSTALVAISLSVLVGGTVGLIAGYVGGWIDRLVAVLIDASLALPALVVLIAVTAIVGVPYTVPETIVRVGPALALIGVPTIARVSRANALNFAQREFVAAARSLGASNARIMARELAPNVGRPLISYAFTLLAVFIVAEGSLAFLGLGLQQPEPTWGNMLAEGTVTDLRTDPHVTLVPAVVMFATVLALSRVGDRLSTGRDSQGLEI